MIPRVLTKTTLALATAVVLTATNASYGTTATTNADAKVWKGTNGNTNYGTTTDLHVQDFSAASSLLAYVRFDLSGYTPGSFTDATLDLTSATTAGSAAIGKPFYVWGLRNSQNADGWGENTITYNNAPGLDGVVSGDGELATQDVDTTNKADLLFTANQVANGVTISLTNANLLNFLNADTDGKVTFIIGAPQVGGNPAFFFASKEHTTLAKPTLTFTATPADSTPPTLATLNPADNATGVPSVSNLVATFNEAIAIGTGNVTVRNLTDATESTIAITDGSQVSVAGAVLTVNPAADLLAGKDYAIRIDATAIKDPSGNFFAGISDDTTWNFTIATTDTFPPLVSTLSPADNATGVAAGSNLVVTFNEAIATGTGNITVKNLTDATESTIAITDGSQVAVAGSVLTINSTADLVAGKDYAIRIDATAIKDTAGNSFAGISDDSIWNFATDPPPLVSTLSPADDATSVAVGANLVVTFNEAISIGTGNVTIRNLTDATDTTIAVTDGSQVAVAGAVLTVNPAADLTVGKDYAIWIDSTSIKDSSGNFFAGIADDTTWNFTTDATPPTVVTLSPADDATDGSPFGNLVVTFNEAIAIGTGNITIKNVTDATQSTIAITDGGQVSVAGSVLTINPTADLTPGKSYAIRIDATAIKDSSGNFFAGISDDITWNFATWPLVLFDDFATNPAITTQWTKYNYYETVPTTPAPVTWNSTNQDLDLAKTTSGAPGWIVGFYRTGSTRSATDPVTMTVKNLTMSGGTFGFLGLMITAVQQQGYIAPGATGDSYTLAMTTLSATTFRFEVRRTYQDGTSSDFILFQGPTTTFAGPYTLDITRNGDHYDFKANGTTLYTTTGSGADFYTPASKDSMIYYQVVFGGDRSMSATIDDFGIPSGTPTSGYASWQSANGATGQALNQDHDGDGVPNGIEYFLVGPNGTSSGFTALPGIVKDPGTGALSVTWPKGSGYAGTYGTHYWVETSETLADPWTPETLAPSGQVTDTASTVTYTFPTPLGSKKFARLMVTGP